MTTLNGQYKPFFDNLTKLDLSNFPVDEIRHSIQNIGFAGTSTIIIHPGDFVMRARKNETGVSFTNLKDISYKPSHLNNTYYRASTPKTTMFYGSIIPNKFQLGDIDRLKLTTFFETSSINYSNTLIEEQYTFGLWTVKDAFQLSLIATQDDFMAGNPNLHNLGTDKVYVTFKNIPSEVTERNRELSIFFTSEFSKTPIKAEYDYLYSALFTEYVVSKKISGVYYPSIRTEYSAFNIAVQPEIVDNCMSLVKAIECTVYKKDGIALIDNVLECKPDINGELEFKPLKNSYEHFGKEKSIKIISDLRQNNYEAL